METLSTLFLLFLAYSFIGWLVEMIYMGFRNHKIVNRGFLIGPICPIYGCGGVLMVLLLSRFIESPLAVFFLSIIVFAILEYLTSLVMEKLFRARWWDYSNEPLNINGRICIGTIIPFGLLGLFVLYIVNPFILGLISALPAVVLYVISGILAALFIADLAISFIIINKYRFTVTKLRQDSTEEITKQVREKFLASGIFKRRLVKAFPHAEANPQ